MGLRPGVKNTNQTTMHLSNGSYLKELQKKEFVERKVQGEESAVKTPVPQIRRWYYSSIIHL